MTQPPITPASLGQHVTVDGLAPEVQTFVRFLMTARLLTPKQLALLTDYAALGPDRQKIVDDLIHELLKLTP